MNKTSTLYNYFSAFSAFIFWGSWSYSINSVQSNTAGLVSGFTQGIASFIITLVSVIAVTKIYNKLPESSWRFVAPVIITVSCIGISLVIIHSIAETPRIVATISPSVTVAFLFCIFTTFKLKQTGDKNTASC